MANLYDIRHYGTWAFLIAAIVMAAGFIYISDRIVDDVSAQERARMEIWADATRALAMSGDQDGGADVDFLLRIVENNRAIPVILTDRDGNIILHRNFDLPEKVDADSPLYISDVNRNYLQGKVDELKRKSGHEISVDIAPGVTQHLYYADSRLLDMLNYYPYIQIGTMLLFVLVVYYAVMSTKKAEQNKVWVGLSKETAHQLGTPISSLMAWVELLKEIGVDSSTVGEINKDVMRLSTVASRFGKIGSRPALEKADINKIVSEAVAYMDTRISSRIDLRVNMTRQEITAYVCESLFQWVLENLIKNAVDAMDGSGVITVTTMCAADNKAVIEIHDTGKGIPRNRFKTVFKPGYTTKKRGWGLGLALAKRIISEYHGGEIYVASSDPDKGTVFRIKLPCKSGRIFAITRD